MSLWKIKGVTKKGKLRYLPLNTWYDEEPLTQFPIGSLPLPLAKVQKAQGVRKPYRLASLKFRRFVFETPIRLTDCNANILNKINSTKYIDELTKLFLIWI